LSEEQDIESDNGESVTVIEPAETSDAQRAQQKQTRVSAYEPEQKTRAGPGRVKMNTLMLEQEEEPANLT